MNAVQLDPRRHVYRDDLAAASLKDKVKASRYAQGELRQVVGSVAPVRIVPRFDAPLLTEALTGELVTVYDLSDGWAWVQLEQDGYVGYMPADNLSAIIEEPSHWVIARATFVYPAPDLKRPPITRLSFNGKLRWSGARAVSRRSHAAVLYSPAICSQWRRKPRISSVLPRG